MDLAKIKQAASQAAKDSPQFEAKVEKVIPDTVPGRTVHVDGDFLAYFAAGGGNMPVDICRSVARDRMEKFRIMTGSEHALCHLSTGDCTKGDRFFVAVTQPYQGKRGGKKPKNWGATREYIEGYTGEKFALKNWRTREADDGAAYCAETRSGGNDAVASKDKDWRMFAGVHCDWDTFQITVVKPGDYRVVGANGKDYGHYFFWWQLLRGDTADEIPGVAGFGPESASQYLDGTVSNAEAFHIVSDVYKTFKKKKWEDYMVEQAALLWMRTDREASLLNFLTVFPEHDGIIAAANRMAERVAEDKRILAEVLSYGKGNK